jgi:hypothetical protein
LACAGVDERYPNEFYIERNEDCIWHGISRPCPNVAALPHYGKAPEVHSSHVEGADLSALVTCERKTRFDVVSRQSSDLKPYNLVIHTSSSYHAKPSLLLSLVLLNLRCLAHRDCPSVCATLSTRGRARPMASLLPSTSMCMRFSHCTPRVFTADRICIVCAISYLSSLFSVGRASPFTN